MALQMFNKFIIRLPDAGEGVRFSLRGIVYQNNSLVTLEDIGEGGDALVCVTDRPACCYGYFGLYYGHWFFPNGSRIPSYRQQWDIYRTRDRSMVRMNRWRGGVTGIYRCEIPDAMNVTQTIYIGVYTASAGEWYMYTYNKMELVNKLCTVLIYLTSDWLC